jgi:hypothetical protein
MSNTMQTLEALEERLELEGVALKVLGESIQAMLDAVNKLEQSLKEKN